MQIIVPATSANLGPGFDCLGLSLKFFNKISIKRSKISSISISGEGEKNIYFKKNNAFVKIFNEYQEKLLGKRENFSFKFENNIPISRGLGSSSAVIVSAIASAYFMAEKKMDKNLILNEALKYENHPDNIAPAVLGGFVCSLVKDTKVLSIKKDIDKDLKAVLVIPNKIIKTEQSRAVLPKKLSFDEAVFNVAHSSFLTACFLEKKYEFLKEASKDKLHQERRMKNYEILFEVQDLALKNEAILSTLSGSGSSFINITYKDDAKLLAQKFKDKFKNFAVKILDFDDKGFEFL